MVYSTQDYWVCALCPSSRILCNSKTQRFGNWMFPSSCEGEDTYSVGFLRKSRLPVFQWLKLAPSTRSNRAAVSLPPPEDGNNPVSETLCFLVFRISDNGQSPETQWLGILNTRFSEWQPHSANSCLSHRMNGQAEHSNTAIDKNSSAHI
jgi:hypothetical protein